MIVIVSTVLLCYFGEKLLSDPRDQLLGFMYRASGPPVLHAPLQQTFPLSIKLEIDAEFHQVQYCRKCSSSRTTSGKFKFWMPGIDFLLFWSTISATKMCI